MRKIENRKTARVLKSKLDEANNIIESNYFYSIEMKKREEELKKDKYVNIINGKNVNYTVPQRLNVNDASDKLTVFMRVNNIYHDKALVVRSGDEVIAKFKRAHLAPSEMEKVVLSKVLLDKVKGDITISLEDGE